MKNRLPSTILCCVIAISGLSAGSLLLGRAPRSQAQSNSGIRNNSLPQPRSTSRVPPDAGGPSQEIVFSINAPRPLDAALTELQYFGVPLSYEEPVWLSPDDVTREHPGPAPASLLLRYEVDAASKLHLRTPMQTVLNEIVARHNGRNPGEFRVVDLGFGQGFSLIPISVRDGSGRNVPAKSPLDARVTIETKKRTAPETLNELIAAISSSGGPPVIVFRSFTDSVLPEGVTPPVYEFGANNEVARDVLSRLLYKVFPGKMAWRLYYQPPSTPNSQPSAARGRGLGPGMTPVAPRRTDFYGFSLVPVFRATDSQISPDGKRNIEAVEWANWKRDGVLR